MAETVRKKASAKKATRKKATKKQMLDAVDAINGPVMKRGPGRPRKQPADRVNIMDAQDMLDSVETAPVATKPATRQKNAFEETFGEHRANLQGSHGSRRGETASTVRGEKASTVRAGGEHIM